MSRKSLVTAGFFVSLALFSWQLPVFAASLQLHVTSHIALFPQICIWNQSATCPTTSGSSGLCFSGGSLSYDLGSSKANQVCMSFVVSFLSSKITPDSSCSAGGFTAGVALTDRRGPKLYFYNPGTLKGGVTLSVTFKKQAGKTIAMCKYKFN